VARLLEALDPSKFLEEGGTQRAGCLQSLIRCASKWRGELAKVGVAGLMPSCSHSELTAIGHATSRRKLGSRVCPCLHRSVPGWGVDSRLGPSFERTGQQPWQKLTLTYKGKASMEKSASHRIDTTHNHTCSPALHRLTPRVTAASQALESFTILVEPAYWLPPDEVDTLLNIHRCRRSRCRQVMDNEREYDSRAITQVMHCSRMAAPVHITLLHLINSTSPRSPICLAAGYRHL